MPLLLGTAPSFDLALLKLDPAFLVSQELQPLELADSDTLEIGQKVLAIGNPLGFLNTLTTGIISGLSRELSGSPPGLSSAFIQTDAAINPGDSGGPLLDSRGRVIGVNTATIRDGENLAFALPSNIVALTLNDLVSMGHTYRPSLGLALVPLSTELAKLFGLPAEAGLLVEDVQPGSPAESGGLRAGERMVPLSGKVYVLGGDILLEANGAPLKRLQDLTTLLLSMKPGDRLTFLLLRENEQIERTLILPPMHFPG